MIFCVRFKKHNGKCEDAYRKGYIYDYRNIYSEKFEECIFVEMCPTFLYSNWIWSYHNVSMEHISS